MQYHGIEIYNIGDSLTMLLILSNKGLCSIAAKLSRTQTKHAKGAFFLNVEEIGEVPSYEIIMNNFNNILIAVIQIIYKTVICHKHVASHTFAHFHVVL